ncbi:MAG: hypothetical protein Q8Q11_02240 [bacterium]|nr:hypothetical protein [bacterium]MDZ4248148.1 hypothetical protein [Patescibacteria group bacterium]
MKQTTRKETRTYADRREYLLEAVAKRRRRLREMVVQYKGGKCQLCGYDKCRGALEFHHLDPATKSFGLSARGMTRSWERMRQEADKCILVCANCHREVEAGLVKLS